MRDPVEREIRVVRVGPRDQQRARGVGGALVAVEFPAGPALLLFFGSVALDANVDAIDVFVVVDAQERVWGGAGCLVLLVLLFSFFFGGGGGRI